MREYLFQVRGQGVDELRQQLERMAADGQTALDRLSSAAKVLDGVAEGGARVASASASVANGVRTMAAETSTALNTLAGTAPAVSATAAQIKAVDTGARAAGGGLLALSAGAQAATGDAAALGQAMGSLDRLVVVQAGNVQLLTDQAGKASTALVAVGQAGTTAGTGLATVGEGMAVVAQGASGVARAADSLDILAESAGSTAAAVDNSVSMVKLFGYALVTWAGGAVIDNVLTHMERLRGATEDYRAELEQTAEAQNSASQALVGFAEHQAKISIARYALEGLGLGMASGILTLATRINLYVAAVAGLIEIAGKSVHAADELEQANASLADRLTRTGYTAGLTATQIQALALAQEGLTRQSAIQITGMAESLTGVRSLTAETFQPALKALQNLTSYMKGDAAAASKALATALDAPLTATSALEAADIRLDYQQREAIRSFEALNDRVGAHGVILAAVNDQTHHAAEAMDETERANKRLSDSWTHLKEAIGAGLGELGIKAREVGSIISSLIPSIPFGDWVADFNENLVGHLGTLPLETQLERATKRLEKAQADLATATKSYETDGGMMAFDMLQAAENSVAVMTQRVEAIRAKIAEAPPADKPAADDGAGRAERDRNAELLAGITRDQSQAFEQLVPPSAVERLKRINSELETTRTKIGNLRNKDGSNADAVAAQVAQAEAIAAQRAAKLLEMPSKGDEAERIKAVRDEASRLVTATRQLAREDGSNAGVITQTVQAIEKERDAKVALIREENQGKASKKDLVAVSDAEARGALALAAATLEGVDAAMQQAAANEAHKKALSDSTVAEDALRRALLERKAAETLQGGAQEVASLTKRADGLAQVAAAARDGAAAEADVELQVKAAAFAEEKLAAARVAGGGVFLDLAEREILAYDDLLKREQDLTRQREVNRTIAARQDALDLARQELALQDLSTEAKAVEIARLTAINDLKKYGNSLSAEQRQLYVDTAVAQAQQQQAAQAMQRIAETAKGYWNDVRGYIVDGLTEATKSGGKAFDDLWDAARKGLRRFLINAALDMAGQKLVLPVITPLVGAVSGAGGGQSPPVTIGGQSYVPVGQSGSGLMGQGSGGLTVGNVFSQASGGWLDRQLGGGITSASNWLNTTAYGGSAPTAEMMAGIDDVGQLGYAADAGGVTYGDMLGGAGYGIGAIMNFANGNTVAGIGQTAAAVMSFIPGLQVAAPFVAIAGQLLGGLFGKDRGPPAAAAAVQYNNSDQTYAASATDNEGDEQQAKELLSSIDAATRQFVTILGGRTAGEFGVAVEAKDDRYRVREGGAGGQLAGSYDTLDEAVIAGFRYNVSQGLIEASDEVLKAVQNSTSKDINEFMKDVALGKSIADATAGLKDLDQSLAGVAARAKEAQASQYKAVDAELERAQGLGLGDNYRSILEHQLRSTFLSAGQSFTSVEIAEAQYAAQTEATVEAVKRWNLSITEAEVRADAAAKAEQRRTAALQSYQEQLNSAKGMDWLNSLTTIADSEETVRRNLAAVGVADAAAKATELITEQAKSVLRGLDSDELKTAAGLLTGSFGELARSMQATQEAADKTKEEQTARIEALKTEADALRTAAQRAREVSQALTERRSQSLISGPGVDAGTGLTEAEAQWADLLTRYNGATGAEQADLAQKIGELGQTLMELSARANGGNDAYYAERAQILAVWQRVAAEQATAADTGDRQYQEMVKQTEILTQIRDGKAGASVPASNAGPGEYRGEAGHQYKWVQHPDGNWSIETYETGGVIGNGVYGRDSVLAYYANGRPVKLAGGEGVLTAAATAGLGGADGIRALNRGLRPSVWGEGRMATSTTADDGGGVARIVDAIGSGHRALADRFEEMIDVMQNVWTALQQGNRQQARAAAYGRFEAVIKR